MRLWLVVAVAGWLGVPHSACGQGLAHSRQAWAGLFAQGPVSGNLLLQSDVHYRVFDQGSPAAVIVRPGLGWLFAPGLTATLGYAYTPAWPAPGADAVGEHRAWQQGQLDRPVREGALRVQVRSRLEQRARPAKGDDLGLRFRQFVRVTKPLNERLALTAWDEVFVALNRTSWGQLTGLDQNRLFAGVAVHVVPRVVRVEVGYFNQLRRTPTGKPDLAVHVAMVNAFVGW